MGGCTSKPAEDPDDAKRKKDEKIRDKWISDMMVAGEKEEKEMIKLLFLGAGESGKSTLMKQMIILHGDGMPSADRMPYVPLIHQNIIQSAQVLSRQSIIMGRTDPRFCVAEGLAAARDLVLDVKFDDPDPLKPPVVAAIKALWEDPGIALTFENAAAFQLSDSTEYFVGRLDAAVAPGYVPTKQDVLRARIRTTGIVEHRFLIDKNDFRIFDVGGQRNARKKWIHCFDAVTSVIFVASLGAYNQVLYEDSSVNGMHEALNLFEDICNSKWFVKTSIILFLNKKDIFKAKIAKTPLTVCFPDYKDENTYRAGCKYIKDQFRDRNHRTGKRIYAHFTCATDTDNINKVFRSVQHIILRSHLIEIGLINTSTEMPSGGYDANDEDAEAAE